MPKHQVDIEIIGSGGQITLYVIDNKGVDALIKNSKSDNKLEYYEILDSLKDVETHHICTGIDLVDDSPDISLSVDGKAIRIDGVIDLTDLDDQDITKYKNSLFYNYDENVVTLNGSIPLGKHAVVIVDWYKDGVLSTSFKTNSTPNLRDLRLEFIDIDGPSDFCECSYHLGISGTLQYDLKSVLYEGKSYEFDFECSNFKSSDIYLLSRDKSGRLKISPNSDDLF